MLKASIIKMTDKKYNLKSLSPSQLLEAETLYSKIVEKASKSEADFHVMRTLLQAGLSEDVVLGAFRSGMFSFCKKYKAEKDRKGENQAEHYLKQTIAKASKGVDAEEVGPLHELLIDNVIDDQVEVATVRSPIKLINRYGGYIGLTTLLGAPKVCKSTLALQSAVKATNNGVPTLYVDFENGPARTGERLERLGPTGKDKFYYMNLRNFSERNMLRRVDQLSHKGTKVFLIVDSIQKLPTNPANVWSEMRNWLLVMERIKLEYNCVVLAISEKKREFYTDHTLGSGKGTSSIEYNSDMVLNISRNDSHVYVSILTHRDRMIPSGHNTEMLYFRGGMLNAGARGDVV